MANKRPAPKQTRPALPLGVRPDQLADVLQALGEVEHVRLRFKLRVDASGSIDAEGELEWGPALGLLGQGK